MGLISIKIILILISILSVLAGIYLKYSYIHTDDIRMNDYFKILNIIRKTHDYTLYFSLYFSRYILQSVGGCVIGFAIPVGYKILPIQYILVGLLMILFSMYCNFIYRTKREIKYNGGRKLI